MANRAVARAFVSPVTVVQSGSTLTFSEGPMDGESHGAVEDASFCFFTAFGPTHNGAVQFAIVGDQLYTADDLHALEPCDGAAAQPDGSFLVSYHCPYHPQMAGKILVHG